jgi:hypothetical protein
VRACDDCHAAKAPFFFAEVMPLGPIKTAAAVAVPMHVFMGADQNFQRLFGFTFTFRPLFKLTMLVMSCVIALVLLLVALKTLEHVVTFAASRRK